MRGRGLYRRAVRRAAEWLLLPLFLLPLGVALGLHIWAQTDYDRQLQRYREGGLAEVSAWQAAPHTRLLIEQAWSMQQARLFVLQRRSRPWHLRLGGTDLRVQVRWPRGMSAPSLLWRGAEYLPAGVSTAGLADPETRLALQLGQPEAVVEAQDAITRAFQVLLKEPRLLLLAQTALPATTKQYLVRRWIAEGVTISQLQDAVRALELFESVERVWWEEPGPWSQGLHRRGDVTILASGAGPPLFQPSVLQTPVAPRAQVGWFWVEDDPDGLVRLSYLGLGVLNELPQVLWQGRVEVPIAGNWAFVRRHGGAWWSVPRYRRWIGPVGALLLAFVLIPTALLVSMRRRRRLDEARSRFLNELGHDLRTPLTSLRLYAEMLEGAAPDEEVRARYVRTIARESERVSALLANLLDLSRLEDGRGRIELRDLEVAPLARLAQRGFVALYPKRAADLTLMGDDDLLVRADETALSRCLANLLDNAGKYTEAGVPIRLSWLSVGAEVCIRVSDKGPGIPPGERATAFERYSRGARARRDGLPGTGLGLSLVKDLLHDLQG